MIEEYRKRAKEAFPKARYNFCLYCYYEALRLIDGMNDELQVAKKDDEDIRKPLYQNIATCYFKMEKHADTIKTCTLIIARLGENPKARYLRGASYEMLDDVENAIADLEIASKALPEDGKVKAIYDKLVSKKMKMMPKKAPAKKTVYTDLFEENKLYDDKPIKQKSLPKYNPKNPRIFIDLQRKWSKMSDKVRIVLELFADLLPTTCRYLLFLIVKGTTLFKSDR